MRRAARKHGEVVLLPVEVLVDMALPNEGIDFRKPKPKNIQEAETSQLKPQEVDVGFLSSWVGSQVLWYYRTGCAEAERAECCPVVP